MKRHLRHIIPLILGLILMVISIFYQDIQAVNGTKDWIRILSNAALLPGVLLAGTGLMAKIAGEGFFDGIRYAMSELITHLRGASKKYASYNDYIHRDKSSGGTGGTLPAGLIFLAAAAVLTGLYYLCP